METSATFAGLSCIACGEHVDASEPAQACPVCGGLLDPEYHQDRLEIDPGALSTDSHASMWAFESVLPFDRSNAVSIQEGGTPLIECQTLADEFGLEAVYCKDEGANPTGSLADRGQSLAVTAARARGAEGVTLASPGNGGQAAAAYAARAGLEATVYVPSRADFTNKAMINVHGAEMNVVGGRLDDAVGAFEDAQATAATPTHSLCPFETPYRHEGCKTIWYELLAQLDGTVPDAVVAPTGSGLLLAGLHKAIRESRRLELIESTPTLVAVQPEGCAPIVDAFEADRGYHEPCETPDTICGELEVPDPTGSPIVLDALADTDDTAVAVEDDASLESACSIAAREGLEPSAAAGAGAAGTLELAGDGWLTETETVVLVNPGAGSRDDDILRSYLMGQGK
jgi:threonine synthase